MATTYKIIPVFLAALLITACSGGGGGGNSSNTPSSTASSGGAHSTTPVTPPTSNSSDSGSTTTPPPVTTPTRPAATTHSLQLSWAIPTTRENGVPLTATELAGYQVYYYLDGTSAGDGTVVNINGGAINNTQITLTGSGTYYFAIAARDQGGLLSNLSNYVSVTLN